MICLVIFQKLERSISLQDTLISIDGLAALVQQNFHLDPFQNALFLFCGHKNTTLKALYWEQDGFVLLYKRLENGKFKWPRTQSEAKEITVQQLRWLLEGLNIEQPKRIQPATSRNII